MALSFVKVEGLGNDFVLLDRRGRGVEAFARDIEWARAVAPRICDRRRGIGADGVLIVGPGAGEAAASMIVVNFDGSRPEMCGNGLRCVAAFVAAREGLEQLEVDTDAGIKRCRVSAAAREPAAAGEITVAVDMGPAELLGTGEPAAGEGRSFIAVSMGNPHAVSFVAADEDPEALARGLGPALELDPAYWPAKTNVEFAQLLGGSPLGIRLWVWERGVGITQACGTGACATAVAAVHAGLAPPEVELRVELPGGALGVRVPSDRSAGVIMRGPGREVFTGQFDAAGFGAPLPA